MTNRRSKIFWGGLCMFAVSLAIFSASNLLAADSLVSLHGNVPQEIQRATLLGRAQADELVLLSLIVRLAQELLNQTSEEIYGRNAPTKKHFLSTSEFAQRFDLAAKRQVLKAFAQANGLAVDS